MNKFAIHFYSQSFHIRFLEKKGEEFQNFFASIMEKRYRNDFVRTRPWGRRGDQKNDGYLKSQKNMFQVYAPNELTEKKTLEKIDEDFKDALKHWEEYLDKWTFVHNSRSGLGPEIIKKLLSLEKMKSGIIVNQWGFEEIKKEFLGLNEKDMEDICGKAPTEEDMEDLTFKELNDVISSISRQKYPEGAIKPVSKEKMNFNSLSKDVETLLIAGMRKSSLVKKYFDECEDPKLGDEIAEVFRKKYLDLKTQKLNSEEIFTQLHIFTGGTIRKSSKHEAAVLAVLAHLFEMCDIFENPPEVKSK